MALNIYGQLCRYCIAGLAMVAATAARAQAQEIEGFQFHWSAEWIGWVFAVTIAMLLAAAYADYKERRKKEPEDKIDLELERYAWVKKARKDNKLDDYKSFYASYNDARKGLVKASDVRFTCPALFEQSAMNAAQGASNANATTSPDPALPKDARFQTTAYFAVIVTKERLILHFKFNRLSTLDPFTVPIDLSQIQADPRGVVREGKEVRIRTNSGTVPLVLKCAPGEFNEIVGLLMEGTPRVL